MHAQRSDCSNPRGQPDAADGGRDISFRTPQGAVASGHPEARPGLHSDADGGSGLSQDVAYAVCLTSTAAAGSAHRRCRISGLSSSSLCRARTTAATGSAIRQDRIAYLSSKCRRWISGFSDGKAQRPSGIGNRAGSSGICCEPSEITLP